MKIQLDEKFVITSDSNSFTLSALTQPKDGKEKKEPTLKFVGSYGDLGGALNGYIKNNMRTNDIDFEITDVISYLKELEQRINNTFKEIK